MTRITGNKAAWLPFEKAKASEVGPGPQPDPAENEVVIKVAYAAVNPTDWKVKAAIYLLRRRLTLQLDARHSLPSVPLSLDLRRRRSRNRCTAWIKRDAIQGWPESHRSL